MFIHFSSEFSSSSKKKGTILFCGCHYYKGCVIRCVAAILF